MKTALKLTLDDAKIMLDAAEAKARNIGVPMDIAVVDDGGNLLAFRRMDGAKITSIAIAIDKAYTAAGSRRATHEYSAVAGPGGPAFGINTSNQGRFTIFGGGLPIIIKGEAVGGIGSSSGTADQDTLVSQAGMDALLAKTG